MCIDLYALQTPDVSNRTPINNCIFVFCGIGYWPWSIYEADRYKAQGTGHTYILYLIFNPNLNCEDFQIRLIVNRIAIE